MTRYKPIWAALVLTGLLAASSPWNALAAPLRAVKPSLTPTLLADGRLVLAPPAGTVYRWLGPTELVWVTPEGTIDRATYTITIDGPTPPTPIPPVPPEPVPPTPPTPPVPPIPPVPVPVPTSNLRVLFLYESADIPTMPQAQQAILLSSPIRSYLKAHCPMETLQCTTCPAGTTVTTPSYRFFDKNVDPSKLNPTWQGSLAAALKYGKVPCVLIVNAAGKSDVYPWPENEAKTLDLLQSWGGK